MAWSTQYVSRNELKHYLRIPTTGDTADDAEIDFAREAASRAIDQHCNRQFGIVGSSTHAREYTPYYDRCRGRWIVETDDFPSTSSVTINVDDDGDAVFGDGAITAFRKWPFNAAEVGRPHTTIIVHSSSTTQPTAAEGSVQIKAKWGWAAVPDAVKQATLLQASRIFVRRNSPYGVAGSPEAGSELRLLSRVDPDVAVVLQPFKKQWGAV